MSTYHNGGKMTNSKLEFNPIPSLPRITVSLSEKINMGNYESKDVFISISQDLPMDFDVEDKTALKDVSISMFNSVRESLNTQINEIKKGSVDMSLDTPKKPTAPTYTRKYR